MDSGVREVNMKCWCLVGCLSLLGCGGSADPVSVAPSHCTATAGSQWLTGQVSAVLDGDTVVLGSGSRAEHIRLQGIDAPELAQNEGPAARQALSQLALNQSTRVAYTQLDRYGRVLGQVFNTGCKDLNLHMLQQGQAWFYTAYACDLELQRRTLYASAQTLARSNRLGLWQQSQPMAPWVYRNGDDPATPVCAD